MIRTYLAALPRRLVQWSIVANVLVTAAVVAASLLATPIYRSEALLVPRSVFSSSGPDIAAGAQAALLGIGLGSASSKLAAFEPVLKSSAVVDRFLATSGLRSSIKRDYIEDYRDIVSNIVVLDFRKDGTITVAVEDKSPVVAQKYAQAYVGAFEYVSKSVAERSSLEQADALTTIVQHTRAQFDANWSRLQSAPIDESIVRADASTFSQAYAELENKLLQSRMVIARLQRSLADDNPDLLAARAAQDQLEQARRRLLAAAPSASGAASSPSFSLDAALARQSATIVGAYTQAHEKVMVDAMMAGSPYLLLQQPTLPEKRIRPQRRRMITFALMCQALATIALLGTVATLRQRRNEAGADA